MYSIEQSTGCTLLLQGCNDTYEVKTADGPSYILRIYRHGWRTLAEIYYEVDALLYLTRKGISVSTPIPDTDGQIVRVVPAPEGIAMPRCSPTHPEKNSRLREPMQCISAKHWTPSTQLRRILPANIFVSSSTGNISSKLH